MSHSYLHREETPPRTIAAKGGERSQARTLRRTLEQSHAQSRGNCPRQNFPKRVALEEIVFALPTWDPSGGFRVGLRRNQEGMYEIWTTDPDRGGQRVRQFTGLDMHNYRWIADRRGRYWLCEK